MLSAPIRWDELRGPSNRSRTDIACPEKLPPSWVILLCAYQLTNYKAMSMIRAPATRAVFAEHAARLEQFGALLICMVCGVYQGSIYVHMLL